MLRFVCPSCNKQLSAPEEKAGVTIACPSCKKLLAIPAPPPIPVAAGKLKNIGRMALCGVGLALGTIIMMHLLYNNKVLVLLIMGAVVVWSGWALWRRHFGQAASGLVIIVIAIWMFVSIPRELARSEKVLGDVAWILGNKADAVKHYEKIDLSYLDEADRKVVPERIKETTPEGCLNGWLDALKAGNTGEEYWVGTEYSRLFSVRSGVVLSVKTSGNTAFAKVRIDSSNKGGVQITVTWDVSLRNENGIWKITEVSKV